MISITVAVLNDGVSTWKTGVFFNNKLCSFWFCGQKPTCHFFCSEDDSHLFEKALANWKLVNNLQAQCHGHHKLAKMRVVRNQMKHSYGRLYFACSERMNPCSHWMWAEVDAAQRPVCRHGFLCSSRKLKKEGVNKDRMFFCCPNDKENSCKFFWMGTWRTRHSPFYDVNFSMPSLYTNNSLKTLSDLTNKILGCQ